MAEKLYLLDAMALIYRAHFAFIRNPRINSKGVNTSAMFGFTNTVLDICNKEKPTHIGIVYDTHVPTFRHEQYAEYKANRQEQPEDIAIAIPYIYKLADALGIPNIFLDGYEADDIIGTLAVKGKAQGMEVFMMTPDKDYGQVVQPGIHQYKPGYQGKPAEIWGVKEVCDNWNIQRPEQVIDILALMGDAVDNIPGVKGIGPKTAASLVNEFGSVEGIYENIDRVKGKTRDSLLEHKEAALMSKRLATIDLNVPIELDPHGLHLDDPHPELFREILEELEFRSMLSKFFPTLAPISPPTDAKAKPAADLFNLFSYPSENGGTNQAENGQAEAHESMQTIEDLKPDYTLVEGKEARLALLNELMNAGEISFDTETTGLNAYSCRMVGFSFSNKTGKAWYVSALPDDESAREALRDFLPLFENQNMLIVGQNLKFDMLVLKKYGIELRARIYDTMLAHYLLEPDMRHGMDLLAETYLNYRPIKIETLIGSRGKKQLNMGDLPAAAITKYAGEDADITLQLKQVLAPMVEEVNAAPLLENIELPLTRVLAEMEYEGVNLDAEVLREYSLELQKELQSLEQQIHDIAGMKFNLNSPAQLGQLLFEILGLDPKAKKTKTGQYATGEDVLQGIIDKHPVVKMILDYRQLQKLKSTYVDALPGLVNAATGRLHTTYNQTVAATGRLSSTEPNLQNIPIRTEQGRKIREAFIARDKDHLLLSADYSQIELRLIAALSNEEAMLAAFASGQDIHRSTAARIYGIHPEEVTSEQRRMAKTVNFGIIYGMGAFGLAQRLGISRTEASALIKAYNEQYPAIHKYLQTQIEFARANGYVETIMKRRRYLRDINSNNATTRGYAERNAINAPIQGSAADMIKKAMVDIYEALKQETPDSRMILQVHDELVFDVRRDDLERVKDIVHAGMVNALPDLGVPIEVEMGTGHNWLEAH